MLLIKSQHVKTFKFMFKCTFTAIPILLFSSLVFAQDVLALDSSRHAQQLFQLHCAECHGQHRLGAIGPALLPTNLKRLRKPVAVKTIQNGRPGTPMPAFKEKLTQAEIELLAEFIYRPLAKIPAWGLPQIKASHVILNRVKSHLPEPVFKVKDALNLFMVVEQADHHISIIDGDTFEPRHRFKTRFSLYGGVKFSPGGRYAYYASRDGWISKYDIYSLKPVAEIRAGINTRNLTISGDGRYLLVANYLPHSMVLLDTRDLAPIKYYAVKTIEGKSSRVSAVYTSAVRNSFFAALKDIPELWEISYADEPPHGFGMWMHDYRTDSGENTRPVPFPVKRYKVSEFLDNFYIDQEGISIFGMNKKMKGQVLDTDVSKVISGDIDLPGFPHFGAALKQVYKGNDVLVVPNMRKGIVTVLDADSWKVLKNIKTLGPGFFMRTHNNSPYIWIDVFFGANKDAMHVIDKSSLEIVKTLRPAKGKKSAHVEFSRDGQYALVSVWDKEGSLVIYNTKTLQEVKRIPMKNPAGKYNIYNRLH